MKKFLLLLVAVLSLFTIYPQDLQHQAPLQKENPELNPIQINKILSYSYENFEGEKFPPSGWILEYTGPQLWTRYKGASAYGKGSASALFHFLVAQPGITQSLIFSSMHASAVGDTLQFDHAYCTFNGENDQLIIETSTDRGKNYSVLVTLNGGISGPLVTAPPQAGIFVPTAPQWKTKRYALPAGTNRIRFKAVSAFGNNLYLDNVTIGHQSDIDVGIHSIDVPNPLAIWTWTPKVTVGNYGIAQQTFTVTLLISPGGYSSTKTVTALPGNSKSEVSFDSWTPAAGTYNLTAFTDLTGDMDTSNDTMLSKIIVSGSRQVSNINAIFKDGQVFVTWDNLDMRNATYTLYKSPNPIRYGYQLASAQNLGYVGDASALDQRLTELSDGKLKYLRIDSASSPLASNKGLFVATSTEKDSFYYAVTAKVDNVEDTTIIVTGNAISIPVSEDIQYPQPVWQESRDVWGRIADVYVQFATNITSSIYPQMTNTGSYPFHFALVKLRAQVLHPLTFVLHGQMQSFLDKANLKGIGARYEWVITIDDWIPNWHANTLFYGYHEKYDIRSNQNQTPTSGIIYNYTAARINYTLDWAIRNLPVDSTRVYMCGASMGGTGTLMNVLMIPKKFAAVFIYVPRMNMSNWWWWNEQWGKFSYDLMTNEGYRISDRSNATFLAGLHKSSYIPIMYTFCGKKDLNVGWDDKPRFYKALNGYRHGGFHFWSNTDHNGTYPGPWGSSFPNFSFFTRYRTNLSYPAFSNCSINDNPGNGNPSNGDAIGSINGHLDWDDDIVDLNNRWEITLYLKDLKTSSGKGNVPDSATTDVTLRRLQNFSVPKGMQINWENRRNNVLVQQGFIRYNSGLVTITGVKVYKDSSRLSITYAPVSVDNRKGLPVEFALMQNYPNPFNPTTTIKYSIPKQSYVTLKVYDILGREIKTLISEEIRAGNYEAEFNAVNLPSGVYFYKIKSGDFVLVKKMVLLK